MEYFAAGFTVALVVGGIAVAIELCNDYDDFDVKEVRQWNR